MRKYLMIIVLLLIAFESPAQERFRVLFSDSGGVKVDTIGTYSVYGITTKDSLRLIFDSFQYSAKDTVIWLYVCTDTTGGLMIGGKTDTTAVYINYYMEKKDSVLKINVGNSTVFNVIGAHNVWKEYKITTKPARYYEFVFRPYYGTPVTGKLKYGQSIKIKYYVIVYY